jgi:hypothetical protein
VDFLRRYWPPLLVTVLLVTVIAVGAILAAT